MAEPPSLIQAPAQAPPPPLTGFPSQEGKEVAGRPCPAPRTHGWGDREVREEPQPRTKDSPAAAHGAEAGARSPSTLWQCKVLCHEATTCRTLLSHSLSAPKTRGWGPRLPVRTRRARGLSVPTPGTTGCWLPWLFGGLSPIITIRIGLALLQMQLPLALSGLGLSHH